MSKNYLKDVNNLVDNKKSNYYEINKKNRNYWNSRSESCSCRVREKDLENNAIQFAMNVRAYLLNEDELFQRELDKTIEKILQSDQQQLRMYARALFPNQSIEFIDKNIGLIIGSLIDEQIAEALDLKEVVSCRLLGYEKELFFLKCYVQSGKPALMLRCLYHLNYDHSKFIEEVESDGCGIGHLEKGLDFNSYLYKVDFL